MKKLLMLSVVVILAGCANGTPIDFLIPTRKPTPATEDYLGHLYITNNVNGMYHSLSDTKTERMMIPLRDVELKALYQVARGEVAFIEATGTALSNGVWGAIVAGVGLLGWQIPRPQEKSKVTEALHSPPPNQS